MKKAETKGPMRVGIYGRVSSLNQVYAHDDSVDTQIARIRDRVEYESRNAAANGGPSWQVVEVYREEGRSGKDTARPELQRLLEDIDAGKIDLVIVTRLDRITRSVVDFYDLWNVFESKGVEFLSLKENFDTHTAHGRAMLSISLVFGQMERELVSERTREKIRDRQARGLRFGGTPPPGYRPHPEDKTKLAIDPEYAPLIKRHFFEKFLELQSARAVTRHLARHNIRRPIRTTKRGKQVGGSLYDVQAVLNMLGNSIYIAKRFLEDGTVVECNWEPIVDDDLFQRVQNKLATNSFRRPTGRKTKHTFLLEGLVRCAACGSAMTTSHANGRGRKAYHYYRCSNKHRHVNETCAVKDVPAEKLEDFVLEQLQTYTLNPEAVVAAVRKANLERDSSVSRFREDLRQAKTRLKPVEEGIKNLLENVERGLGTEALLRRVEELQTQRRALEAEADEARRKLEAAERQCLSAEETAQSYGRLSDVLKAARDDEAKEDLKDLLRGLIEVIEWHEDPDDHEKGWADIQLFAQAEEFLAEMKKPSGNHQDGGSLGCRSKLHKVLI